MKRDFDVLQDGEVVMQVRHLWPDDPIDCCMCSKPTFSTLAVPYYCGPALEGQSEGGYRVACEPCYARWEAWNDKHTAAALEYVSWFSPPLEQVA